MAGTHFDRDLARFNRMFQEMGAVKTLNDGTQVVDQDKVPARLLSSYRLLLRYGAANGHL